MVDLEALEDIRFSMQQDGDHHQAGTIQDAIQEIEQVRALLKGLEVYVSQLNERS